MDEIKPEIKEQETYLGKIKILNHFLYFIHNFMVLSPKEEMNWGGNISTVLAQKKGNYIVTSIIYGTRLIILIILNLVKVFDPESKKHTYFYINPIDNGAVLSAFSWNMS